METLGTIDRRCFKLAPTARTVSGRSGRRPSRRQGTGRGVLDTPHRKAGARPAPSGNYPEEIDQKGSK